MIARIGTLAVAAFALVLTAAPADSKKAPPTPAEKKAQATEKVKDPICGMMVDPKTAERATVDGKTYYFCSREERQLFEKNPSKYIKK